jgi:hypothetical protein
VIVPKFIERVGYPLSYEAADKRLWDEHSEQLRAFLHETRLYPTAGLLTNNWPPQHYRDQRAFRKILAGLTFFLLEREGYGGNRRDVFYRELSAMTGKEAKILSTRTYKTGVRCPGGRCGGDDPEWESPYLEVDRTTVALQLDLYDDHFWDALDSKKWGPELWIDRCDVELV